MSQCLILRLTEKIKTPLNLSPVDWWLILVETEPNREPHFSPSQRQLCFWIRKQDISWSLQHHHSFITLSASSKHKLLNTQQPWRTSVSFYETSWARWKQENLSIVWTQCCSSKLKPAREKSSTVQKWKGLCWCYCCRPPGSMLNVPRVILFA